MTSERNLLTKAAVGEESGRRRGEGDRDQRGPKVHRNNWEARKGPPCHEDRTAWTPRIMTEGRQVLRQCLGQKLSDHCVIRGDMQEKML